MWINLYASIIGLLFVPTVFFAAEPPEHWQLSPLSIYPSSPSSEREHPDRIQEGKETTLSKKKTERNRTRIPYGHTQAKISRSKPRVRSRSSRPDRSETVSLEQARRDLNKQRRKDALNKLHRLATSLSELTNNEAPKLSTYSSKKLGETHFFAELEPIIAHMLAIVTPPQSVQPPIPATSLTEEPSSELVQQADIAELELESAFAGTPLNPCAAFQLHLHGL